MFSTAIASHLPQCYFSTSVPSPAEVCTRTGYELYELLCPVCSVYLCPLCSVYLHPVCSVFVTCDLRVRCTHVLCTYLLFIMVTHQRVVYYDTSHIADADNIITKDEVRVVNYPGSVLDTTTFFSTNQTIMRLSTRVVLAVQPSSMGNNLYVPLV